MNIKSSTFISGVFAIGIYICVMGLLFFYFNVHDAQNPKHYVKKNENRIRVTMSTPKHTEKKKTKKTSKKNTIPKKKKLRNKKKEIAKKQKKTRKKVVKERIVKKTKSHKNPKKVVKKSLSPKINKPKDLFSNLDISKNLSKKYVNKIDTKPSKSQQNNIIKITDKPNASALVSSSLKVQKKSDKGIEKAYLAAIEEILRGWPAQSDYAGETVKVWIKVETDGYFEFRVLSASGNEAFNESLVAYLKQLQLLGFGPHKGNRAYELNVEFEARE